MRKQRSIDIAGQVYGHLKVMERAGSSKRGIAKWLCKCECGQETVVRSDVLRSLMTKSCGRCVFSRTGRPERPIKDRLEGSYRLDESTGCWVWIGVRDGNGYGVLKVRSDDGGEFKNARAHRVSYEISVGEIPKELVLDHICRNRACINPSHLEPVTNKENILRGVGVTALNAKKKYCVNGHPLFGENVKITKKRRFCRTCLRTWNRERLRRRYIERGF